MKTFLVSLLTLSLFQGVFLQQQQQRIKIIFLKEEGQDHIVQWFQDYLDQNHQLESTIINLEDHRQDIEKMCEALSKGATIMLDVTWSGSDKAEKLAMTTGTPYIQLDVSISATLHLLDTFLEFRNSTDVTLIFDNPNKVDEALYFWIDTTLLRMVIAENLDKTTANRLKAIRPTPNNYAIVASTSNMTDLLKKVPSNPTYRVTQHLCPPQYLYSADFCPALLFISTLRKALDEDLITLPDRWNLLFLDFNQQQFNRNPLTNLTSLNLLYLNEEICCKLLQTSNPCDCPNDFNYQQQFFTIILNIIQKILMEMLNENFILNSTLMDCNKDKYPVETTRKFHELLQKHVDEAEDLIYKENFALRLAGNGTVENNEEATAHYDVRRGIAVVEGKEVPPIKAFYRIGITHALPWSYKDQDGSWTGYCADFTRKLSQVMGFDFEFIEPRSGTFGTKTNGTWDGVIGDLATGETDMAITAVVMTADREEVVDFVAPYFEQTGITIVMRKPVRKTSLFKFMTVLKLEVWLSIVAALIATGFMVWFLDKYSPYSARNNKKAYPYPCREFTLKESFWFALTSFTPQGGGEAPKALSGRTLVAAYWLFVVLMLATFTANLAAFLTVERMQTPVQSLEQLAKQSRINYTVVKDSDTHVYFINMKYAEDTLYRMWKELTLNASTDETQYRVWDYPIREQYGHILLAINDSNPVANASEGFRIVNERTDADFAFIHDSSEIKYEISRNCNLTEVGEVFAERPYAVAIQQGSHLQDEISKAILNLQKDRYFEQLQAKYWNHSSKGNCPSTDDNEGITLESLGGVFIATLFGLALAMITLIGEVLYYRNKRKIISSDNTKKIQVEKLENKPTITIGTEFKPVNFRNKDVSELAHITLYPRARNPLPRVLD